MVMTMSTRERPYRSKVARKLVNEISPIKKQSPQRRTLEMTDENYSTSPAKRLKINEDEDCVSSVATNSFYSKKSSTYLTPLERKARRESLETSSENVSQSSTDENEIHNLRRSGKKPSLKKKKSTGKLNHTTQHRNRVNKTYGAQEPLTEIKLGSPRSPVKNVAKINGQEHESPNSGASSETGSEKRFFKSRTPLINKSKKKQPLSASKMTQKGLKMLYKPASLKNKVTPSSPDLKLKKRTGDSPNNMIRRSPRKHIGSWRMSGKNSSNSLDFFEDIDSDSTDAKSLGGDTDDDIPPIPRRSPRKQVTAAVSPSISMASEELFSSIADGQESQIYQKDEPKSVRSVESPRSQSSGIDSVLLLSELESESNAGKSPDKKMNKLHPFFSRGTPQQPKRRIDESSSKSSTPQSKKSNTSTPNSSPKTTNGKLKDDKDQYFIDAGQKLIGAVQCNNCGLTYNPQDGTDYTTHQKFHAKVLHTLRFKGWKKERIAQDFLDGSRIIIVIPDEKQCMKKVNALKEIVDEDLGFVVDGGISPYAQIYMYISDDKRIVGFCIAEKISSAYRMISRDQSTSPVSPSDSSQPWCCNTEPEPAKCGINRIWVLKSDRRRGIARKLLESVRGNFLMGLVLRKTDLAFTDPTPDGRNFAASYTGTPSFLVYKHSNKTLCQ